MIMLDQLRDVPPAGNAESLACVVVALIGTARLALENDTSGQHAASNVATVLGLAEQLASMLVDTCEVLTRDRKAA